MTEIEKDNSLGIIGPKLLNRDMSLQYLCCNFPSVGDIIKAKIWGDYSVNAGNPTGNREEGDFFLIS